MVIRWSLFSTCHHLRLNISLYDMWYIYKMKLIIHNILQPVKERLVILTLNFTFIRKLMVNTTLSVLPVGLLYRIFDYCDALTILNLLRYVCKRFNQALIPRSKKSDGKILQESYNIFFKDSGKILLWS